MVITYGKPQTIQDIDAGDGYQETGDALTDFVEYVDMKQRTG